MLLIGKYKWTIFNSYVKLPEGNFLDPTLSFCLTVLDDQLPHCFLISASFHSGLMAYARLWSRYGRTRMKMAVVLYPINYSHKS